MSSKLSLPKNTFAKWRPANSQPKNTFAGWCPANTQLKKHISLDPICWTMSSKKFGTRVNNETKILSLKQAIFHQTRWKGYQTVSLDRYIHNLIVSSCMVWLASNPYKHYHQDRCWKYSYNTRHYWHRTEVKLHLALITLQVWLLSNRTR